MDEDEVGGGDVEGSEDRADDELVVLCAVGDEVERGLEVVEESVDVCEKSELAIADDDDDDGDAPARRILTRTPARRKSAILTRGTKYPMWAGSSSSDARTHARRKRTSAGRGGACKPSQHSNSVPSNEIACPSMP